MALTQASLSIRTACLWAHHQGLTRRVEIPGLTGNGWTASFPISLSAHGRPSRAQGRVQRARLGRTRDRSLRFAGAAHGRPEDDLGGSEAEPYRQTPNKLEERSVGKE